MEHDEADRRGLLTLAILESEQEATATQAPLPRVILESPQEATVRQPPLERAGKDPAKDE